MRIGDVNQNNSVEYLKLFSNKNIKNSSTQSAALSEAEIVRQYQIADPENYGIPGMDITGRTDYQKIVDVSVDIKDKIITLARKEFLNNYGMTDGEELSAITREYVLSLPEKERSSAAWTLGQMFSSESARLYEIVKSKEPGWQSGQPFDRSILADFVSGSLYDKRI